MAARGMSMHDDKMRDECGVFGIYSPGSNVAQLTYYGLYALSTGAGKRRYCRCQWQGN